MKISTPTNITSLRIAYHRCDPGCIYIDKDIEVLHITNNIEEVNTQCFLEFVCTNPKAYEVDDDNPNFAVVDGVLFSKDMKTLVAFPRKDEDYSYNIPEGVTCIHEYAFASQTHLTSIILPNTLEIIEHAAFIQCHALKQIELPTSLVKIQYASVFGGCKSLERLSINTENNHYATTDGVLFSKDMKVLECYPANKLEPEYRIPDGVEKIADCSFQGAHNLKKIIFPSTISKICWRAFYPCPNLREYENIPIEILFRVGLTKRELRKIGLKKGIIDFFDSPLINSIREHREDLLNIYNNILNEQN